MSERERRVGRNEAVFREVNERLLGLNDTFVDLTGSFEIVCECSRAECVERFSISPGEYEELRSDPTHFAIVPGHEVAEVDVLLERRHGYDLVRKSGEAAQVAQATDPRS